jgi:hypothetical protein
MIYVRCFSALQFGSTDGTFTVLLIKLTSILLFRKLVLLKPSVYVPPFPKLLSTVGFLPPFTILSLAEVAVCL